MKITREETTVSAEPREALKLKHPEPDVSPEEPWQDDVLGRAQIAGKLTNLLRWQRDPFVISIDGKWGTGKTFLLKRWQEELEDEGFRVIYFNAWEDDFCDDPLLSIIGQLSDHFKKGKLRTLADEMGKIAVPLLKKNALSVLSRATGLTFEIDLNERDLLQEYRDQRQSKTELKDHLAKMSAAAYEETDRPLIFIVDELDRCRPTFAIELLERVKHIFDVPDMVFVFGINRDELCKSLESIYGEIDTTIYLRRFFDMEFMLPNVSLKAFCMSMMEKYRFSEFFQSLSQSANTRIHREDYDRITAGLPALCGQLRLSLRDIDYCLRVIAMVARNIQERQHVYPWLLSLLVTLKFENPTLYRQFINGECHASDVMNYLDGLISFPIDDHGLERALDAMEADLYRTEIDPNYGAVGATACQQLKHLQRGEELTYPELLSDRTKKSELGRIERLLGLILDEGTINTPRNLLAYLSSLIELDDIVRR